MIHWVFWVYPKCFILSTESEFQVLTFSAQQVPNKCLLQIQDFGGVTPGGEAIDGSNTLRLGKPTSLMTQLLSEFNWLIWSSPRSLFHNSYEIHWSVVYTSNAVWEALDWLQKSGMYCNISHYTEVFNRVVSLCFEDTKDQFQLSWSQ